MVEVSDAVITDNGTPHQVTKVFHRQYQGDLLIINATGLLPFKCTPEHPFLAWAYDDSKPGYKGMCRKFHPETWIKARNLKTFDLLAVPRLPAGSQPPSHVVMKGGNRSKVLGNVPLSDSLLALIGIYLAEGRVRGDGRTAQFTLHANEMDLFNALRQWASSVGISVHDVITGNTRQVYLYSRALCLWLQDPSYCS